MSDFLGFCIVCALVIGALMLVGNALTRIECETRTEDFQSRYSFFGGCQIRYKDRWIQWDQYRAED